MKCILDRAFFKVLANERGISLVELVIGATLGLVVTLTGVSVMTLATQYYEVTSHKVNAQRDLLQMSYVLRNYLSQAIQIQSHGTTNLNVRTVGTLVGRLRDYNSMTSLPDQAVDTVAMFNMDFTKSGVWNPVVAGTAPQTDLRAVGVFFQQPTPTTSGVLYVSIQPSAGQTVVSPANSQIFAGRFVEMQVRDFNVARGNNGADEPMASAEIRLVSRYFTSSNVRDWRWCPDANMGAGLCPELVGYQDIENIFTVYFHNNDLDALGALNPMTGQMTRVFGPMHFFSMNVPQVIF